MLTPIQESVFVMSALKNTFEPALKTFKRYIHDDDVKFLLQQKIFLDLYSFKEEWARLDGQCANNPELVLTKKICAPALARINQWGGLREFRNKVIAHGFREELKGSNGIKINSPVDLQKWYFDADVPNTYAEVLLLANMAYFCMAIFLSRHGECADGKDFEYKGPFSIKGINNAEDFDDAMENFMSHISSLDPSLSASWDGYETLTEIMQQRKS